jgi:4-hydroxy-3-methylbut-2-enyl diphosphate reductase
VIGIRGWCDGLSYVVNSPEDVSGLPPLEQACVVAQTTTSRERWQELVEILKQKIPRLEIFNSICHATDERQKAAMDLASRVDAMVVVGGRNSSNTRKLYELCKEVCPHTWWVENADELPMELLRAHHTVGITSGASTPDWIIEEVYTKMSEIETGGIMNEEVTENQSVGQEDRTGDVNFAESVEKTFRSIRPGQVVTGTVVQVSDSEICVNIGYKADGVVLKEDFSDDHGIDLTEAVKPGDQIQVQIKKVNDGEGNVLLSCKELEARKNWDALMAQYEAGEPVEGTFREVVKGGIIASVLGMRAFVPASQLDIQYVKDLSEYVGRVEPLKIIEVEKHRHRVVASRRAIIEEEHKKHEEMLWNELKVREGQLIKGVVRRLTDFGAFVDVGGIDGLIHVTDMAWGRVRAPKDVVSVDQVVEPVILKVDVDRHRLSLGLKQTQPKPWDVAPDKYPIGEIVQGRVVRIVSFGAFVELEPGIDGLVHISQVANTRIQKVEDVLNVGDIVNVKVLDVNPEEKRISLSIRAALPREEEESYQPAANEGEAVYSTISEVLDEDYSLDADEIGLPEQSE